MGLLSSAPSEETTGKLAAAYAERDALVIEKKLDDVRQHTRYTLLRLSADLCISQCSCLRTPSSSFVRSPVSSFFPLSAGLSAFSGASSSVEPLFFLPLSPHADLAFYLCFLSTREREGGICRSILYVSCVDVYRRRYVCLSVRACRPVHVSLGSRSMHLRGVSPGRTPLVSGDSF